MTSANDIILAGKCMCGCKYEHLWSRASSMMGIGSNSRAHIVMGWLGPRDVGVDGAHYFSDVKKSNNWAMEGTHKKELNIMRFRL